MHTPPSSIIMFILAALVGAVGQFLYKTGADQTTDHWSSYLVNWRIWVGVVCYIAVMALFIGAFKRGGQLTVLYPIYATTFIWAAVIAWLAMGTPIKPIHLVGFGLLVVGMYMMGR